MITDGYVSGTFAVRRMISSINYFTNVQSFEGFKVSAEELEVRQEMYVRDRDAAIAFGMDISELPRTLRLRTRIDDYAKHRSLRRR